MKRIKLFKGLSIFIDNHAISFNVSLAKKRDENIHDVLYGIEWIHWQKAWGKRKSFPIRRVR